MDPENGDYLIRPAGKSDIPSITALVRSVPGLWHEEWRPDALELALESAAGLAFVWDEAGDILGFCCAHDVGFLAYLSLLVVAAPARHRGIGARLVGHTQQQLAARGCATLISDVWQDAVGFYESLGWSAPGAVLLRKRLAALPGHSSS